MTPAEFVVECDCVTRCVDGQIAMRTRTVEAHAKAAGWATAKQNVYCSRTIAQAYRLADRFSGLRRRGEMRLAQVPPRAQTRSRATLRDIDGLVGAIGGRQRVLHVQSGKGGSTN